MVDSRSVHNQNSLVSQYCLDTVVPTLDIMINHDGGPFIAGQSYNLTCTVTLENTTRTPTVEWLDSNNNPLHSRSEITVGDIVTVNCSTYITILQFTTLHTFHSGQYSCQATLGGLNTTAAVNFTVQSKNIVSSHVCSDLTFCLISMSFFPLCTCWNRPIHYYVPLVHCQIKGANMGASTAYVLVTQKYTHCSCN